MSIWVFVALALGLFFLIKFLKGGFRPLYPSETLVTGGQPQPVHLEALKAEGVTTVINMRALHERTGFDEPSVVTAMGMRYHHLPVSGPRDISAATAKKLHDILKKSKGKTLIHCASGNRVGAVLALYGFRHLNMNVDEAMAFGRSGGLGAMAGFVRGQLRMDTK